MESIVLSPHALVWEASCHGCSYYSPELLNCLCDDHTTTKNTLSYSQMYAWVSHLSRQIHASLFKNTPGNTVFRQYPVIVSIPQGPLLPIVIAAVHAANRYPTASAILIPCDLTTATTQSTILQSLRPTLILVANETDASIVQQQLDRMNASLSSHVRNYRSDIPVWQASKPRIVNVLHEWMIPFQTIVQEQIQQLINAPTCQHFQEQIHAYDPIQDIAPPERLSHIVFTSGTSGTPKGCCSSRQALQHYIQCKNQRHQIDSKSYVALASPLSFDPCLGDILATWTAGATLVLLLSSNKSSSWPVTHILCTPTWWNHYGWSNAAWQVIALGGEAIPPKMRTGTQWPLHATYGVTEACVYQTMGPIGTADLKNHVGTPFSGVALSIVSETDSWEFLTPTRVGEIVISGTLVDRLSGYWNNDDAANPKFIQHQQVYSYRTGDRGYFDSATNDWVVMGRIQGQEGMVKYQGVRVELSEIESALLQAVGIVRDCIVVAQKDDQDTSTAHTLVAYLVLEETCRRELLLSHSEPAPALLCTSGPLLTLLHGRCQRGARVIPTAFVIVPSLPMSPTGKRTTVGLPKEWFPMDSPESQLHLSEYGLPVGQWLAESLQECLNLSHHRRVLTVAATFGTLGGDSLAATRVVRALYAHHASVDNTRFLGGDYGTLPGDAFAPVHLLRARNLGAYVDFLMSQGIGTGKTDHSPPTDSATLKEENALLTSTPANGNSSSDTIWYDALLEALQQGQCEIASALLQLGAPAQDPTVMTATTSGKRARLGNISSRNERRKHFQSTPLHVACVKGRYSIVSSLIQKGARWNIPDASGLYPLHLVACSRTHDTSEEERWKCLECLLAAGAPLTIKDGNQQSLLHAAARAGHTFLLQQLLTLWRNTSLRGSSLEDRLQWRDVWSRTAVHWAVLNGHWEALQVLLEAGCDPQPLLPHKQKRSSVALETPLEMNDRLYRHDNPELHQQMQRLLQEAMEKREK
ncbi:hypothetical protein FisN_15Lh150 [Fistulifera solaris]|uniref:AMP-dependent synthetase/ligase domain-containing protein n=1 Tax=Fistulifera solaris TaxID=1519565 RepID=A0A1Z5KB83_FISSO|nr:hypothetical protein FisN_15Lh150 [Fistulifera solaris]|eukprot:GAX23456.1 hypothetical protein FisN_15Lh150 [Fistulifera solaris]